MPVPAGGANQSIEAINKLIGVLESRALQSVSAHGRIAHQPLQMASTVGLAD
jgi:hypothetical protein